MKLLTKLFLTLLCLSTYPVFAQDSTLCNKEGPRSSNDKIQEQVYTAVHIVKQKKLADTTLKRLQGGYDEVRKSFNDLYKLMTADIGIFNKRKNVCEKYSDRLETLIDKAQKYDENVFATLKIQPPASVGADDIVKIIEWIWKLGEGVTGIRRKQFYKGLEWMEWKEL